MKKTALITGGNGQSGPYLAEFLLGKGYRVVCMVRRNATAEYKNIEYLSDEVEIVEGDLTDMVSIMKIIQSVRPHEAYNTAAQSHVHTSFEQPVAAVNINMIGPLNVFEAVKTLGYSTRIYQASTSELWGSSPPPQCEETIMQPQSPYAVAKLGAHWLGKIYRQGYGMYIVNGITHNFESPKRGPLFVTRKISLGVAKALQDPTFKLQLGNLDAQRDWSFCGDMVKGWWLALQQEEADDYVFASGEMHSIREFLEEAFGYVGLNWEDHVEVNRFYMRPLEVEALCGDATKAKEVLGWTPEVSFKELVHMMVEADCKEAGINLSELEEFKNRL